MIQGSCRGDRGKAAEDLFEKYEGQKGVYIFRLPPALIGIFVSEENNPELKKTLRRMELIKIMVFDESVAKEIGKHTILQEFDERLNENQFSDMFVINDSEKTIKIKFREDGEGVINEMMILITEGDAFLGLSMVGRIDQDQLKEVAKSLEIEDFRNIGE